MTRLSVNRSGDMEAFVQVVDLGSFSAAARALDMTPSAISKLMARVEARIGVRLLYRSTREVRLTPEGETFLERSRRVLEDIDAAEREVAHGAEPRGRLRINCNVPFGLHCLLPALPGFLERHSQLTTDVVLSDAVVDPITVRTDVAIRTGPLRASSLVARKLAESRMIVVASPGYLKKRGTPRKPADLLEHNRLGFCFARHARGWPFTKGKQRVTVPVSGNALAGDGEALRALAIAGLGIARLAAFHVGADVDTGRLVPLLETHNPGDTEAISVVSVGPQRQFPSRVRAFLDWASTELTIRRSLA